MINLTDEQINKQYAKTTTLVVPADYIIRAKNAKPVTKQQRNEAETLKMLGMETVNSQAVIIKVIGMNDLGEWMYEIISHGGIFDMCLDMGMEFVHCIIIAPRDVNKFEENQEVIEEVEPEAKPEARRVPLFKTERAAKTARSKLLKSFSLEEYKAIRGIFIVPVETGYILETR